MDTRSIIAAVDAEIAKLKEVRALLALNGKVDGLISRKSTKKVVIAKPVKHVMSPEARERIADAQRKRWAKTKRAAKKAAAAAVVAA
jgi:hypothetical protein